MRREWVSTSLVNQERHEVVWTMVGNQRMDLHNNMIPMLGWFLLVLLATFWPQNEPFWVQNQMAEVVLFAMVHLRRIVSLHLWEVQKTSQLLVLFHN